MKRTDPLIDLATFCGGTLLVVFALAACLATAIRGVDAQEKAATFWGNYETATRQAFMRDETLAFETVTNAAEELPDEHRDAFAKAVVVALGLAAEKPDDLSAGVKRPEDFKRVREALEGFENADALMELIKARAVEKPLVEVVEVDAEPTPKGGGK